MATYNDMQLVKREFFARRNGVIVDMLRKAGAPYRIIFGLTLPQIKEIAETTGPNLDLALKLWENRTTRESAMLAPYLFPEGYVTPEIAFSLTTEAPSGEITDILCIALLRRLPFARELAKRLLDSGYSYAAMRLYINLLQTGIINTPSDMENLMVIASAEADNNTSPGSTVARQIIDEISFIKGEF